MEALGAYLKVAYNRKHLDPHFVRHGLHKGDFPFSHVFSTTLKPLYLRTPEVLELQLSGERKVLKHT